MKAKILTPIILLVIGGFAAYLLGSHQPDLSGEPYERMAPTVRVLKIAPGDEYLSISSQGTVQPRSQSELIPEVSGRVIWMSPSLVTGGAFKQGDALLRINDADYRTQLARSEAALQRSQVEHQHADAELERLRSLHRRKLASQQQLDDAQRSARVAKANFQEASANLDQSQRDLARTELIAPFDGLVRNEHVDVGQFITRGQSIGTIYATDAVEVRLPISSAQLRYTGLPMDTRGQIPKALRPPVTVATTLGGQPFAWQGALVRLEAEIDERSRMVYGVARLSLDQNGRSPTLPVGMFVSAEIRGERVHDIVRLPRSAMRDHNQVLVVDAENRLHFRQVSVLRLEHDEMLIDDGLSAGELVSISPLQTVVEGMSVSPVIGDVETNSP